MKYTRVQRERLVDAFKFARERIANKQNTMICFALDMYPSNAVVRRAKRIIHERLEKCPSYEEWVDQHHPTAFKRMARSTGYSAFRQGRLQWLDSLIKEFSS